MKKNENNISVLLPVYNGEKTIKMTIKSLLNQSYSNFIVYICDDGSTDNSYHTILELESEKIRIFKNDKNMGLGFTLNKLMQKTEKYAEFIAFAEQDDYYYHYRLEKQIQYLKEHEDIGLVSGIADHWDGNQITSQFPGVLVNGGKYPEGVEFFIHNYREQIKVVNSCIMLRKSVHYKNKLKFSETYPSISVDWDYVLRFSLVSNIHGLNISLVKLDRSKSRESLTNQSELKYKIANILIRDFYEEFPDVLNSQDYRYACATQKYIELSSFRFFKRIFLCLKIFLIDPSKYRCISKLLNVFYKPVQLRLRLLKNEI